MRRPPNRRVLAATALLLVAAAVAFVARPAVGVAPMALIKQQTLAPGGP